MFSVKIKHLEYSLILSYREKKRSESQYLMETGGGYAKVLPLFANAETNTILLITGKCLLYFFRSKLVVEMKAINRKKICREYDRNKKPLLARENY